MKRQYYFVIILMIFSSSVFSAQSDAKKMEQTPASQATEQKHDEQIDKLTEITANFAIFY